jgi:hypothetical protein
LEERLSRHWCRLLRHALFSDRLVCLILSVVMIVSEFDDWMCKSESNNLAIRVDSLRLGGINISGQRISLDDQDCLRVLVPHDKSSLVTLKMDRVKLQQQRKLAWLSTAALVIV